MGLNRKIAALEHDLAALTGKFRRLRLSVPSHVTCVAQRVTLGPGGDLNLAKLEAALGAVSRIGVELVILLGPELERIEGRVPNPPALTHPCWEFPEDVRPRIPFRCPTDLVVWIEGIYKGELLISLWYGADESRSAAEGLRCMLKSEFGTEDFFSLDWACQGHFSIHFEALSDGAVRNALLANLLKSQARRDYLWHVGPESWVRLKAAGIDTSRVARTKVGVWPMGGADATASYLLDDRRARLTAEQLVRAGDAVAMYLHGGDGRQSLVNRASQFRFLAPTLEDPEPFWLSLVMGVFPVRVFMLTGPMMSVDFMPGHEKLAIRLLRVMAGVG